MHRIPGQEINLPAGQQKPVKKSPRTLDVGEVKGSLTRRGLLILETTTVAESPGPLMEWEGEDPCRLLMD